MQKSLDKANEGFILSPKSVKFLSRLKSDIDSAIDFLGVEGTNEMKIIGIKYSCLVHLITQKRFELW